ncbi:MAG: lipoate--protein ligase family protein [Coriobacteriia bacterium]|nr:lipoate--protein ligase family protein [Coriobacteriia bacterium]
MAGRTWRVLIDGPVDGARNMALDRAVLASVASGVAPPTLRLYRWQVPTVTLGRFQPLEQVDLEACDRRGFDVVRRPTGGRGVLHDDELTYSVVAGVPDGVPRGTAASYRHLSAALAAAYRSLGVPAEVTARQRGVGGGGACYLHTTQADLSLGAAKLSGSAQVWMGETVLQHGSFVISRDVPAEAEVFRLTAQAADELGAATATLEGALGRRPSLDEISSAVTAAFERTLGITLELGVLSCDESALAERLTSEHRVSRSPST